MPLSTEIKRKLFHHLSLVYMAIYAFTPGWFSIGFLGLILLTLSAVEFIRLRRPEVNDRFLKAFGGLHRPTEILAPSGIFWTLAGSWLIMVLLEEKTLVLPILGMLVFGDTAAALCGQRWGVHYWRDRPVEPDPFAPGRAEDLEAARQFLQNARRQRRFRRRFVFLDPAVPASARGAPGSGRRGLGRIEETGMERQFLDSRRRRVDPGRLEPSFGRGRRPSAACCGRKSESRFIWWRLYGVCLVRADGESGMTPNRRHPDESRGPVGCSGSRLSPG